MPDVLGDTHEAMNRAVELADVNTDLHKELHDVENTNRQLEEDALNTAETLTQKLQHMRVSCWVDSVDFHLVERMAKVWG